MIANLATVNYLERIIRELEHLIHKFEIDADDARGKDLQCCVMNGRRALRVEEALEVLKAVHRNAVRELDEPTKSI